MKKDKSGNESEGSGWKEQGGEGETFPETWRPARVKDALEGVIVSIRPGKFGLVYRVRDAGGKIWALPRHVALISRLEDSCVGPGDEVRIICSSIGSREKGDYYSYRLLYRSGDRAPF